MADVRFGYLSREYADRHMGAFRLNRPPMLEKVSLAVHQGNHCFALIGKRAEILKWLTEVNPEMLLEVTETFSYRKNLPQAGLVKVSVRSVHVGMRFFYLMFGKKLTNKLLVEFCPWDGKSKPGEPLPLDKDDIDDIPLNGESILVRSESTMTQVAEKLRQKRRVMDEAGGIKVMGIRMERASTFSSVHRTKSNLDSPTDEKAGTKTRRGSSFSITKHLGAAA
ncbi:hypothetical protein EDD21DRAFT_380111 [Dissophora ornata]|nr:hypothetical protein BGZ58_005133 [Dissophora ornata]KAI8599343.1 hypothetical protein EDD21DRAFT_380111 [Dissophora ornata]